jgi:cell division protein FtsB
LWRRDREREHENLVVRLHAETATVARLQTENARLRQRVAELENLVGQLKTRLWAKR